MPPMGYYTMPEGPQRQKRPADVIGNAVTVAKIATGEIEEETIQSGKRKAGLKGTKARSLTLSPEQRSEIASVAAQTRWKKKD